MASMVLPLQAILAGMQVIVRNCFFELWGGGIQGIRFHVNLVIGDHSKN